MGTSEDLQLEKLELEVQRLHRDAGLIARIGTRVAPFSTLVAVLALSWTVYSSLETQRRTQYVDAVSALVRGTSAAERMSGVTRLGPFWSDHTYREQLRLAAVEQIAASPDVAVRMALRQSLLNAGVDANLLTLLAKQNRRLQWLLRSRSLNPYAAAILAPGAPFESAFAEDTSLGQMAFDLGENIETLLGALGRIDSVTNVDFSGVTFSQPILRVDQGSPYLAIAGTRPWPDSVRFIAVKLQGANLTGLTIRQALFRDVNLDGAFLGGVEFDNVIIDGRSSMRNVSSDVARYRYSKANGIEHELPIVESVTFRRGRVRVADFYLTTLGCAQLRDVEVDLTDTSRVGAGTPVTRAARVRPPKGTHVFADLNAERGQPCAGGGT